MRASEGEGEKAGRPNNNKNNKSQRELRYHRAASDTIHLGYVCVRKKDGEARVRRLPDHHDRDGHPYPTTLALVSRPEQCGFVFTWGER